jgi:hypothetical protein
MPASGGRKSRVFFHASADAIAATIAGGVVLLVFYPLTVCAAGVKTLVRMVRPHSLSHGGRNITTTN